MLKKQNVVSSPRRSLLGNAAPSPRDSASSAGYLNLLSARAQPNHALRPSYVSDDSDHRSRFLSDAERVIVDNQQEAKKSFAKIDAQDTKMWALTPIDVIAKKLATDVEIGLDSDQVSRLLVEYGPNELEAEPRTPLCIVFLLQFYNLIIGMLLFAAVASLSLQEYVEGIAILFIVTLNAVIATIQENSASNALEALASMSNPQSTVIRDGVEQMVDSKELVPGDIVLLKSGDVVPADIRLHHSVNLKSNEMLLTGESEDVSKKYNASMTGKSNKLTDDNMVFSSTTITAGNARGIVVETGMNTRVGSIALLLQSRSESEKQHGFFFKNPVTRFLDKHQPKLTPLQRALHKLGFVMGTIALTVCALVFVVGMVRGTRDAKHPERPVWLTMVMISVSLAVSAVPEGLPMVVTICLSTGTCDMVKKNVLVRKLAAVETLGAASVICTDKTGTLTEGKMTAVKLWGDFKEYDITGKGFTPAGAILLNGVNVTAPSGDNVQVRSTLMASVLCSNTQLKQVEGEDGENARWMPFGNSSEAPLVVAAAKVGIWEDYLTEDYKRVAEVPFNSSRKMMVTVHSLPTTCMFGTLALEPTTRFVACVKGAPNYIADNCTRFCQANGTISPLSDTQRQEIAEAVDNLSSQALRVLAVAINPLMGIPYAVDCDDVDDKFAALSVPLVFLGLVASIDPERDGVRDAIELARMASIRTVMITGDYLKTAVAIAKNIDLLQVGADPDDEAADCFQLRPRGVYLPTADIDEITSRTLVFARAKPEDKLEIVKSLQRQGLIAAMTGDGVNDAPALKEADIGVAMGIAGTEVAKGASDMLLTDDNFVSIVSAVDKGRIIYANIQKFVIFLLSTNIGEILLIFSTIAAGCPLPLEALQILILNLFSDGMPAVALSMEKGDPNIMENRPRPKQQHLIHGRLWLFVAFNAVIIAAGAITAFLLGVYWNFGHVLLDDIYAQGGGSHGIDVTCTRWEGINDGWRVYGNCAAQYSDGSYIFGEELSGAEFFENSTMYCEGGDFDCLPEGLARSQTMTFICITFTEVMRAFTVRNFTEPVFVGIFANKYMWFAAVLSVCLTILVTNTPVVMDGIFGFAYIPWFQWLVSCIGAVNAAFWGEILKMFIRRRDREQARWDEMREGFEAVLLEIRHVRHHVERLEK